MKRPVLRSILFACLVFVCSVAHAQEAQLSPQPQEQPSTTEKQIIAWWLINSTNPRLVAIGFNSEYTIKYLPEMLLKNKNSKTRMLVAQTMISGMQGKIIYMTNKCSDECEMKYTFELLDIAEDLLNSTNDDEDKFIGKVGLISILATGAGNKQMSHNIAVKFRTVLENHAKHASGVIKNCPGTAKMFGIAPLEGENADETALESLVLTAIGDYMGPIISLLGK